MAKNKKKNRNKNAAKGRSKPRTMALSVPEAKLRGPRYSPTDQVNSSDHANNSSSSASMRPPAQIYETMHSWSPWHLVLRQQAVLAQGFAFLIGVQRQAVENWSSLLRPAARRSTGG